MTDERFTETVSTGIVTDNMTGKEFNCDMRIDDELLELLNSLSDENRQLKEENEKLKSELDEFREERRKEFEIGNG